MASLAVRYAFDTRLQKAVNANGLNYWTVYIEEILSRLGVAARPMDLADCADPTALHDVGVLVMGGFRASDLAAGAAQALAGWLEQGGVLIGFATGGLDRLFGVSGGETIPQPDGPFSIGAYLELTPSPVTEDCRAAIDPQQRLIIVSPVRRVTPTTAQELARLFVCDADRPGDGAASHDAGCPAIAHHRLGTGHAFYFAFDVAQTLWAIQQGRPVDRDRDGDGYLRIPDACVIGDNSRAVPYTDALHFLLANMIGRRPVPMIDPIPPREGRVAPTLLYFGGDDEHQAGLQVAASDFMAQRGLPYHMNIMPLDGQFALDRQEQAHIEANGHEIALHYNFMDGFDHPCGFTREDVLAQARLFREAFGRDSVCSVTHWCRWTGWAEPARWMLEAGGLADNSRLQWTSPPVNPVNRMGFAFGSAFPHYHWDDAAHGNARVAFLSLPIVAYEVGYQDDRVYPEKLRDALDLAVRYRLTLNFFYHPCYIVNSASCRQAIDELVRLIGELPVPPVLMGPDEVARWWAARSRGTIDAAEGGERSVSFQTECDYTHGFVVRVPTGEHPARECQVDGAYAAFECMHRFGQHWALVPLTPGRHAVRVSW